MPKNNNLYDVLGIDEDVTKKDIKKAYRKKANETHPDKENGDAEKFAVIKYAYEILIDPKKREHYDKTGEEYKETSFDQRFGEFVSIYIVKISIMAVDYKYKDLSVGFMDLIRQMKTKSKDRTKELEEHDTETKQLIDVLSRLSRNTKGERDTMGNIFHYEIENRKRLHRLKVEREEDEMEFLIKAEAVLKDYSYRVDEKPEYNNGDSMNSSLENFLRNSGNGGRAPWSPLDM